MCGNFVTFYWASRSAYPGVSEEILERVSQAKTTRIASLLWPIPENLAPLLQGEELRYQGHGMSAYKDKPWKTANKSKLAGTECDCVELPIDVVTPPRSLPPAILVSPLSQIASQFSLRPIPEVLAPSLEQGVERKRMGHRINLREDELNILTTEHNRAKISGRSVTNPSTGLSVPLSMLAPPPLPPDFEEPAPFLEWGEEPRRRMSNQGFGSKTREEVEIVGEREEGRRKCADNYSQF
ncbi:hypothetical protein K435DRAFT_791006 [Dendrothele bispora CBS 962.96]|uniref:Uncharacterized protein n=1 Tax=Dendrothele bispora (strain CBS 962.96) TaxID=1314807 RepID=A0A4S8MNG4_DENBC|nr:hypothetical protein K435DRAFT_791006 [Dendrothele bispora CBS 962.96]